MPAARRRGAGLRPLRPVPAADPGHSGPGLGDPAGHLLLAAPVLAATCWAELRAIPPAIRSVEPFYALLAQLIGWSAVVVAVAASVARSRFADLGGAIAAPITFAIIALAWYTPQTAKFLVQPPAIPHSVAIGWYAITVAALILTCATLRDHWHRYTRILDRLPFPQRDRS